MMDLHRVQKRLRNLRAIHEIVSTLRALSAVQLREGSAALDHVRVYEARLRGTLSILPAAVLAPPRPTRVMTLVLGSDQGLCGPMTRDLVDRAERRLESLAGRAGPIVAVGRRTRDLLEARGREVRGEHESPASLRGADRLVEALAAEIEEQVGRGACDGAEVAYTHHAGTSAGVPSLVRIYPAHARRLFGEEREPPRIAPRTYEPPSDVARALLAEWTYMALYRSVVESLTSEQAARLRTTDAATRAAEKRLEDVRLLHNRLRQDAITEELAEIVAGAGG